MSLVSETILICQAFFWLGYYICGWTVICRRNEYGTVCRNPFCRIRQSVPTLPILPNFFSAKWASKFSRVGIETRQSGQGSCLHLQTQTFWERKYNVGHIRCMHAHPHRRKDQIQLRSLRDLRSPWVFAPVRLRLARWEHKRPQGAAGQLRKWGHIRDTFYTLNHFIALKVCFCRCRQLPCPLCRISMPTLLKKIRQNVPCFRQNGIRQKGHIPKERDRKSELVLGSTYQIFEWDRNNSDRNFDFWETIRNAADRIFYKSIKRVSHMSLYPLVPRGPLGPPIFPSC